ncbi:MAG: glutamate-cysteine ligase family protein [Candidatus Woesearchaeota archaeon]|nr:glutamate-cysteine ligase family protein [Candidatus Woesearchaeota archaeon]
MDWLAAFTKHFPKKARRVGLELEFPVVNQNGDAATWNETISLLLATQWQQHKEHGHIAYVTKEFYEYPVRLNTDVGAGTIELALPPLPTLATTKQVANEIIQEVRAAAESVGLLLLTYGIQPKTVPTDESIAPTPRNAVLQHWFPSKKSFPGGDFLHMTMTASYQVHIDVSADEAARVATVLNWCTPACIALCANSPIWGEKKTPMLAFREYCWDLLRDPTPRYGIMPRVTTLEEYFALMCALPPICTKRGNEYFRFKHNERFEEFLVSGQTTALTKDNVVRTLNATFDDVIAHNSTLWFDARLKPEFGTVELRCCDPQPLDTLCAPAAFALGLVANLAAVEAYMLQFTHEQIKSARVDAIKRGIDGTVAGKPLRGMITTLLTLAKEGLEKLNEETTYLQPFFDRVLQRTTPAAKALDAFAKNGIHGLLELTRL